jgi:transposase-like protein
LGFKKGYLKWLVKKCIFCHSDDVKKNGRLGGIQRYQCLSCHKNFSSKRRPKKLQEIIFHEYVYKRQTLKDLAARYHKSSKWIQAQIKAYEPDEKIHDPRAVVLVCDATFYGKRKDKLGTLVFKDAMTNEVLLWKHIESERQADYFDLRDRLLDLGYTILSATVDGKRGLFKVFAGHPKQMCIFHQIKIVQRYITLHPRLDAGKDLKKIVSRLKYSDVTRFTKALDIWHIKYRDFIEEKTINPDTGKAFYTHQKVRAAYRSLRANLPYLFTYKNHKEIDIPRTTNPLEAELFSPMKNLINVHAGMSKSLKLKMVDDYLVNHNQK